MTKHQPRNAFIFHGGWDGHEPGKVAALFRKELEKLHYAVDCQDSTKLLADAAAMAAYDLVIPCWTMGTLSPEETSGLSTAVRNGAGLAGVHGGMGDAFRGNIDFEWMVGGHFLGHPHVGDYTVRRTAIDHEITDGLPAELRYNSEQYYMMADPAITVLADTMYEHDGSHIAMPVVWTKTWGKGRVFYSSLGHALAEFKDYPAMLEMVIRGFVWATRTVE
jgi:type 1 glutamine amidotransferase